MTDTITKGSIYKEDFSLWNGTNIYTGSRQTSTGGTQTLSRLDWPGVDVAVIYGEKTKSALSSAANAVGSNNTIFWLAPGAWTITENLTLASNIAVIASAGATINISAGVTLTINGYFDAPIQYVFNGSGSLVIAGAGPTVWGDWFGSTKNRATLNNMLTVLGSTNKYHVKLSAQTWTIDDDLTITSNMHFDLITGTLFNISATKTLTINGTLIAPIYQLFSGSGSLVLSGTGDIWADWFGASRNKTTLSTMLTLLGSTNNYSVKYSTGTWTIDDDLTLTQNIDSIVAGGCLFSISTTKTLTILGGWHAASSKVFSIAGTGAVVFEDGSVQDINPRWFGVTMDGTTDDATAWGACIASAIHQRSGEPRPSGITIRIPPGTSLIGSTITIEETEGLSIVGTSMYSSRFLWDGDSSSPMFLLNDCRTTLFSSFQIKALAATPLEVAIRYVNSGGSTVVPTNNIAERLFIHSETFGGLDYGIHGDDTGAGGDNNNDFHVIRDCTIYNYNEAAIYFQGQNSHCHRLINNDFWTGKYMVYCEEAFFHWYGGGRGDSTVADFYISNPNQPITIIGHNTEGSDRFIVTGGPAYGAIAVTVIGSRWASNDMNADRKFIQWKFPGVLNLIGNEFGAANGAMPLIEFTSTRHGAKMFASGNKWFSNTTPVTPYDFSPTNGFKYEAFINDIHMTASNTQPVSNTFDDGDATPSIYANEVWRTANTGATTITELDDSWSGKRTIILFGDSNTTIDFTGTNLRGNVGADWTPASGDWMEVVTENGIHYCSVHDCTA